MTGTALAEGAVTAGIDVGGTKTAIVVTDADERLYHSELVATDHSRLADQLVDLVRTAADAGAVASISAVGVAAPGHVDSDAGTVRLAVNLGQAKLAIGGAIETALGIPCHVEHDARAAAIWLYDRALADGRPVHGLAYLSVGTGIAAGVVIDGQPVRGMDGLAGEIGHIVADPAGPRCGCGLRGCLEALAAGPAIARRAAEAPRDGRPTSLPSQPSAEQVFAAAEAGDALAAEVIADTAIHLARAIRALALAFGVERILVGGGVAGAGEALRRPLMAAIADEREQSWLVDQVFAATDVALVPADAGAGARGAALIARRVLALSLPVAPGGKGVGGDQ